MSEQHFHTCIMHKRIATCKVKYAVNDCEDLRINGECLTSDTMPYGHCGNFECQVTIEIDNYKMLLDKERGDNAKLKAINTQFRTLLLTPITADKLLEDSKIDLSGINALINRQKTTWEVCDINTILYLMEYHQKFAEAYAQYCTEKIGLVSIPKHKEKIKKFEDQKAQEALAKAKEQEKAQERASAKPKTPYEKFIAQYMKLGHTEESAKQVATMMGMKP